jgi:hypothetical protein
MQMHMTKRQIPNKTNLLRVGGEKQALDPERVRSVKQHAIRPSAHSGNILCHFASLHTLNIQLSQAKVIQGFLQHLSSEQASTPTPLVSCNSSSSSPSPSQLRAISATSKHLQGELRQDAPVPLSCSSSSDASAGVMVSRNRTRVDASKTRVAQRRARLRRLHDAHAKYGYASPNYAPPSLLLSSFDRLARS